MIAVKVTTDHEPSYWLRSTVDNVVDGWRAKTPKFCPHPLKESVGCTALWLPERLVCMDCAEAVFALDGPADRECDRCHEQPDYITAIVLNVPMTGGYRLSVSLGLCPACSNKEGLDES